MPQDTYIDVPSEPQPQPSNLRHGMNRRGKRAPEYGVWASMWSRCSNPNHPSWKTYGARGITVCEEWRSFERFFSDMGKRPTHRHTVERINNNLGYSPYNCRWALPYEQSRNSSRTRLVTRDGITLCLKDWCERLGISYLMVKQRVQAYNWPVERALTEPTNVKFRKKGTQ